MTKIQLISLLLIAASVSACGSESANRSNGSGISFGVYDVSTKAPAISSSSDPVANSSRGSGGGGGGGGSEQPADKDVSLDQSLASQSNPIPTERKIIRNAELSLESEQPEESQKRIAAIAESKGGFVVESQQSSADSRTNTRDVVQMMIRVPAARFTETVEEVKSTATRVIVETVKGEDVTEEFIDIDARLKAKRALELQFMEIMKRANSVADALSVQSELADVRAEIEKIEGRKRFLENQASLSSIRIRLQTPAVFAAQSAGFSHRLYESFGTGFDVALNLILGLVTFAVGILPLVVFIGLPGYFVFRAVMRRRRRSKSVSEIVNKEVAND